MKSEVHTMRLIDAPVGLLEFDGTVILKTEYMTRRADGSVVPDCYIVESGEYFCGGVETAEELKNLEVTQVRLDSYGERHFPDLTKMAPLTLEQLREMDGKPVRMEDLTGGTLWNQWIIFERHTDDGFIPRGGGYFGCDSYGVKWLSYAYPPAYIDREAWTAEWKEYTGADAGFHYCSKCGQTAFNYEDGREVVEVLSDFCPSCARAMTPGALAELEKRMGVSW